MLTKSLRYEHRAPLLELRCGIEGRQASRNLASPRDGLSHTAVFCFVPILNGRSASLQVRPHPPAP